MLIIKRNLESIIILTPPPKKLCKAVVRGSKKAIANECMKDPMTTNSISLLLLATTCVELAAMRSRANFY